MHVLILTYGSRGDVQPYVAVGKGLIAAGHRVTLATSVRFRNFVEAHGLTFAPLNDDLLAIVDTVEGKDMMERGGGLLGMVRASFRFARRVRPINHALWRECWEAAQAARPDVILFHPKAAAGPHIAEKLGIAAVLATPIPMLVPTREWRFPIFPPLPLGGAYNRFTFRLIRFVTNRSLKPYAKALRQTLGLPPLKRYDLLRMADGSDIPVLHAHSPRVIPRPSDWPEQAHITGYWFLDDAAGWAPPPELAAFLEGGPPPVYVGFGSMSGRDPARLARLVVEALRIAGLRGVIASGWGGLAAGDLPETVHTIDHAPHDWLFPRMSAVVHHGGAGTTAAALRAGKPSVILPFFADQPFWGERVHALGAGPKPLSLKRLTAEKLAEALARVTIDPAMIATAAEIGARIRSETGVANAVALIERYASAR